MKNPYIVLSQKERDVARVQKEIKALRTVIPLLADSTTSFDELQTELLRSCPDFEHSIKDGMADLEMYYPFVSNLKHSPDGRPFFLQAAETELKKTPIPPDRA